MRPETLRRIGRASQASIFALACASASPARAGDTAIDPWYTGSLLSPSPAAPRAGLLAFEPYVYGSISNYAYGPNGGITRRADPTSSLQTLTLIKYGITDNLSLQIIPTTSDVSDAAGFDSGSQRGDTSAEFEYLLSRGDNRTGAPKVSASVGVNLPTGRFDHLDGPADGSGVGTYRLRLGLLAQSLLFSQSEHPVRVRVYGQGLLPLTGSGITGYSTYGTDGLFRGYATSGAAYDVGASIEYSFTQRFVFALDIYEGYNASSNVRGFEINGPFITSHSGSSASTQIAPAFEYSFNDNFGVIVGVNLSVAGYNTSTIVQPQVALNYVFDTTKPDFGFRDIVKNVLD